MHYITLFKHENQIKFLKKRVKEKNFPFVLFAGSLFLFFWSRFVIFAHFSCRGATFNTMLCEFLVFYSSRCCSSLLVLHCCKEYLFLRFFFMVLPFILCIQRADDSGITLFTREWVLGKQVRIHLHLILMKLTDDNCPYLFTIIVM